MNALKMSALVCAAVLIGVLPPISGRTETRDLPEIEVLEARPDHGVVRVGDFIIEGTPDHVEITTEGRGLVGAYDFDYTPGEPTEVRVYDSRSGKELITVAPNSWYRAAGEVTRAAEKIIFDFDDIPYVHGESFGVKYTHVDYESVGVEPWEKDVETGDRAYHIHISQNETEGLFYVPVVVLGFVLGLVTLGAATLPILLIAGGLLTTGAVSSIEIKGLIVDETNSFWLVTGKEKISSKELPAGGAQYAAIVIPVVNLLATVPDYYRAGSLLLWDFAGLGDPDEYA